MAENEVKEVKEETAKDEQYNKKFKGIFQIAEVRMLFYVIPVAAILLVVALLLKIN